MALGAGQRAVAQVMKQGLLLTAVGVVAGLAERVALNRLIASLLFGVAADRRGDIRRGHSNDRAGGGPRLLAAGMARVTAGPERRPQS